MTSLGGVGRQVCYVVPHEVFLQHGCEGLDDVFFCRDLYQPRTRRFINYEAELRRSVNLTAAIEGIRVSSSLSAFPSISAPCPSDCALSFAPIIIRLSHPPPPTFGGDSEYSSYFSSHIFLSPPPCFYFWKS